MNPDNPNGWSAGAARRIPWLPTDATPGLDDVLDKAFGPLKAVRPAAPSDDRIVELLERLNSSIRRISPDEAEWTCSAWTAFMAAQPEYLGTEYRNDQPVEFFLVGGVVLVWCADAVEWQHAVAARVSLAGVR